MNGSPLPLEIERKYLIRMPDRAELEKRAERCLELTQTYCAGGVRIRKCVSDDGLVYIRTEKKKLSDLTRIELEREISAGEYEALLKTAEAGLRTIEKTRWCIPHSGHVLEIDVFPFWQDKAFCEVELESEEDTVSLPQWLSVIREVTEDPRYTNRALAAEIPEE